MYIQVMTTNNITDFKRTTCIIAHSLSIIKLSVQNLFLILQICDFKASYMQTDRDTGRL